MFARFATISGSSLAICVASIETSRCAYPSDDAFINTIVSPSQFHVKSSFSKDKEGFYVIYDGTTRNPLCVVEKLTKFDKNGPKETKRPPFFAESLIPYDNFRVHPKEFNDSRYDRGHMAPAADFSADSELYEKTFTMANISPQAPMLNQGFWSRFESWIRHFLLKYILDEAIVITGPVFAPIFIDNKWIYVHRTVGTFPKLVQVPTHFFKVIMGKKRGNEVAVVAAFLVPNSDAVEKTEPVMNYLVKLDQLESIVGFRFLPSLLDDKERAKLDIFVSEKRDLATVLNAKNITSSSKQLTWGEIGNPKNSEQITLSGESGKYAALSKRSVGSNKGCVHLCEFGVDCSKSMF